MRISELEKHAEWLLNAALGKCGDIHDAKDLAQETLLAAVTFIKNGGRIDHPGAWLASVLSRKYHDMLRRKYRLPTVGIEALDLAEETDFPEENGGPEAENIRRETARLAGIYREVVVRHYMNGHSVEKIAADLCLPAGTVKSRLAAGRRKMRKGIENMEHYGKRSFQPERLCISNDGNADLASIPAQKANDLIRQNILIAAYEKPLSEEEIAAAIGVPAAYAENLVDILVNAQLMKRTGKRVYTDFPISDWRDTARTWDRETEFLDAHGGYLMEKTGELLDRIRKTDAFLQQNGRARKKLEFFAALYFYQHLFFSMRQRFTGVEPPIERGHGMRWTAWGYHQRSDADKSPVKEDLSRFLMSGLRRSSYGNAVDFYEFDTAWDSPQYIYTKMVQPMECNTAAGLMYIILNGADPSDCDFPVRYMENIPEMIRYGLLRRDGEKAAVDLPVLSKAEAGGLHALFESAARDAEDELYEPFLAHLERTKKTIPAHLAGIPKWQHYINAFDHIVMRLAHTARETGLIFKNVDFPCPAKVLVIKEK